jgi:hypothetical protein
VRVYQFRHTGMRGHLYPKAGAPGKKKISGPSRFYLVSARRPLPDHSYVLIVEAGLLPP